MECMHVFAPTKLTPFFYKGWSTSCAEYTHVLISENEIQQQLESIYDNATETGWYVELDTVNGTTNSPVTPSSALYYPALKYNRASYSEIDKGTFFR